MMPKRGARWLVLLGLSLALLSRFTPLTAFSSRHARDTNRDGRPDLWEEYDNGGALLHKSIDTNFDGRADVEESFADRHLVRRELDRNFDDQVDVLEEFDPVTGEQTRSLVDVDFDGRADLLVLYANGKPVFSRWATQLSPVRDVLSRTERDPRAADTLRALDDPFSSERQARAELPQGVRLSGCLDASSIPVPVQTIESTPALSCCLVAAAAQVDSVAVSPSHPRGPPALPFSL